MKQFHAKNTATLSTRGFYTILALCGLIIAASVWVLWSSSHRKADPIQDTPSAITPMDTDSHTVNTPVSVQTSDDSTISAETNTKPADRPVSSMQPSIQTETSTSASADGKAHEETATSAPAEAGVTTGAGDPPAPAASTKTAETAETPTVSAPVYVRPVSGAVITPFSGDELLFQPTLGDWRVHTGTDFTAEPNETVLALTDGTVSDVFDDGLYGTCVSLVHTADLTTTYRGLTDVRVVAGQAVAAGEALGMCAEQMDAEAALGTHIHVEAARAGTPVDVLELLSEDEPE